MLCVALTQGAELSAAGVSLTALTERGHSDGAIPPDRNIFLLMTLWSAIEHSGECIIQCNY